MKNNQFALRPSTLEDQREELFDIRFLDESNLHEKSPVLLWRSWLKKSWPNVKSESVFHQKLASIMATANMNLDDYLQNEQQVSVKAFYNVALQLLNFLPGIDFELDHPVEDWEKIHLPMELHFGDTFSVDGLTTAWYWLLATHNKDGQNYLDHLASQGYFVSFYDDPSVEKPLLFNGKTLPVFDPHTLIREVVYVESPQDSDNDGKRDLLKAEILRPKESSADFKVPVIYTASPYNQGTNDETGDKLMHDVNVPLKHKQPNSNTYDDKKITNYSIPAPRPIAKTTDHAEETFAREQSYTLNDYFLARGFAVVYAAGIGTKDSDGFRTTGDEQETISTISIIEWLVGNRVAFTNKTDNIAIKADWSNQKVAMTGRSYLGTLATAAATTGVKGLKTIISEAAISSWYDYYRDNGLVIAPGGFPGEDADVLAEETFSRRLQAGDFHKVEKAWDEQLNSITSGQDRDSGDYNDFWDARNYRKDLKNIKADLLLVHGLNDWNVKPRNVQKLWQGIKDLNINKKLILHQGQHIYINAFRSIDFTDIVNYWLTHELLGVENAVERILPNVIVQDNTQPETWQYEDDFSNVDNPVKNFYFAKDKLTIDKITSEKELSFSDKLPENVFNNYCKNIDKWQNDLVTQNTNPMQNNRLIFTTEGFDSDTILDGSPQVKIKVSSSQDVGLLSFQLIDYGLAKRLNVSPSILKGKGLAETYDWREDDLREFTTSSTESAYKMITKGHINLQNRLHPYQVDELKPDTYYDLSLELQPTFYHLLKGHQLGLIIYATDFGMTVRGNQEIDYQIDPNYSTLVVPIHSAK